MNLQDIVENNLTIVEDNGMEFHQNTQEGDFKEPNYPDFFLECHLIMTIQNIFKIFQVLVV